MRLTWLMYLVCLTLIQPATAQEVTILTSYDHAVEWLQSIEWWGEESRAEQLQVPRTLILRVSPHWREQAPQMPVAVKKELFYRFLLPLAVHANTMVLDRRERLAALDKSFASGKQPAPESLEWLRQLTVVLRIKNQAEAATPDSPDQWRAVIAEALYRLDVIPAGLILGQAAYESGYGTSRFMLEGNALFGQWTFGGEGLAPEQQRKELGDHRIASFEWPFDSIRGYFLNLSSHPAYEDFRRIRAELKAAGKPVTSLALADGLLSYSEKGGDYVKTLKGIIRTNGFDLADTATARDEPLGFVVGIAEGREADEARVRYNEMRKSGELAEMVSRMRLE